MYCFFVIHEDRQKFDQSIKMYFFGSKKKE